MQIKYHPLISLGKNGDPKFIDIIGGGSGFDTPEEAFNHGKEIHGEDRDRGDEVLQVAFLDQVIQVFTK